MRALVKRDGEPAGEVALAPGDEPSLFVGAVEARQPGSYEVVVYAFDPATGNSGVDRVTFLVR